jgi:large subunit ribosomal protein L15
MPLYRRLPKRGFNNPFSKDYAIINLGALQSAIDKGLIDPKELVTSETLLIAGLVKRSRDGVRLLAKGVISSKLNITLEGASSAAVNAVEKIGGTVSLPKAKVKPKGKGKARDRKMRDRQAREAEAKAQAQVNTSE